MGIKGLTKLIKANAPDAIKQVPTLDSYRGKVIAFDASLHIYQLMTSIKTTETGDILKDGEGNTTNHIQGLLSRVSRLLHAGVKPVFVFDGKPPSAKYIVLQKRQELKDRYNKLAEQSPDVQTRNDAARKGFTLSDKQVSECKRLLELMGIPTVTSPSEAEAQCAAMCKAGIVDAVSTEDMDTLTFGSPVLVRNLFANKSGSHITEINLQKVITGLSLSGIQAFIDMCILCGCDYCGTIPGIGPIRALQKIREHESIEGVLGQLVAQQKTTHDVIATFDYQNARELFLHPSVSLVNKEMLKWSGIDTKGLMEYLCGEKGFNPERVQKYIKYSQCSSSSSFPPQTPTPTPE